MKRCPECEFIYEDDQNLCDMDGSHLAFDSQPLPNLQALQQIAPVVATSKRNWKGHSVPAFASLIVVAALFLVYFNSLRPAKQPTPKSLTTSTNILPASPSSATGQLPSNVNSSSPQAASDVKDNADVTEIGANPNITSDRKTVSKETNSRSSSRARPVSTQRTPAPNTQADKKDSKFGSILKKTGRLLKKPFKF